MKRFLAVLGLGALLAVGLAAGLVASGVADATVASDHKVTICHKNEGVKGYTSPDVDKDSIVNKDGVYNGHGLHADDIIPAFPAGSFVVKYEKDGVTPRETKEWGSFPGQGDQSILANGCKVEDEEEDETGMLVVYKVVVNNDGGTKTASDFSFTVDGTVYAFEGDGSNSLNLPKGHHTVGEVAAQGYTSSISDSSVKVRKGETTTVTITNDDMKGEEPPLDVCPNIDGNQVSMPDGMVLENGKCVVPPPRLCPDGQPPTPGEGAYDPNDDCKRPPAPVTETTPAATTDTTPTTTTVTTPTTTPAAPLTPPTTTQPAAKKPAATKPAATKPAVKTAPTTPKKAVAGAFAQEQPKLAYTP